MDEIQIFDYIGVGYKPVHDFNGWRVAVLNYGPRFDIETMEDLERHNETDEIFSLLEGDAFLIVGEGMKRVPMERGKIYNVPKGVWHGISLSRDGKVLIVENTDTTKENSEHKLLSEF